tara:strand:- start:26 stop:388 length:363 start_codon:yes stop_codon:yes gene_type:complete
MNKTQKAITSEIVSNLSEYDIMDVKKAEVRKYEFTEPRSFFITGEAFCYIQALDKAFVGTDSYMGFAYFWGQEYKQTLREANNKQRQKVHNAFIKEGLVLHEDSPKHKLIVDKYCKSVKL